eukprot:Skav219937  [mRNA]  locus=scaffold2879:8051:9157:+ [translate_table: standard]
MARRSNSSTPEELAKVLKLCLPQGLDLKYLHQSPDTVASNYESLVIEMMILSSRPTAGWITAGVLLAFQKVNSDEAKLFGQRLAAACQFCYQKKRQATTGKKLPAAIQRILKTLPNPYKKQCSPSKVLRHAAVQKVMKKNSESSLPSSSSGATPGGAGAVYEQMLGVAASGSGAAQIYERMLGKPLGQPSTPCAKQESEDESAIAVSSSGASGDEAAASNALPIAASMPRGCWYDPSRKAMVRSAHNSPGELEVASMAAGPNGFCVGKFDNGQEFETEVPNMMIVAPAPSKVMKRPGAAPKMGALKRPAAAQVGARKKPAAALQAPVAHPTAPASSANSASPAAPASSGAAPIEENPVFWLSTTNFFC